MNTFKDGISLVYYALGAGAILLAGIRIIYGWFKDYDNASRFSVDMALVHLPYIHKALQQLGNALEVHIEPAPIINFSKTTRL